MDARTQDRALEVDSLLDDLVNAHSLNRVHSAWLGSLFESITLAHDKGNGRLVASLADLGTYLAQDQSNQSDVQAEEFEVKLKAFSNGATVAP